MKSWTPHHFPSAEDTLRYEQRVRTIKRCLIAAITAFLTGAVLALVIG